MRRGAHAKNGPAKPKLFFRLLGRAARATGRGRGRGPGCAPPEPKSVGRGERRRGRGDGAGASTPRRSKQTRFYLVIDIIIIVFEGTGIWSGVFLVSTSVWDSRNWNFLVNSLRSSAVFGGRLQRPSPCLVRSAPRRERGWGLSETRSAKFFVFWAVYARAILGSWHMQSLNE